jgi:tight adherence protein C
MPLDLLALITFLALTLLTVGLASVAFGRRRQAEDEAPPPSEDPLWDRAAFDPDLQGRRFTAAGPGQPGGFVRLLAGLIPRRPAETAKLSHELGQAGYYRRSALVEYLALRNCLVVAVVIVAGLMAAAAAENGDLMLQIVLAGAAGVALVYGLPRLYLQSLGRARLQRIQRGLPDALDLVAMCMAGGLSFSEALDRVARDIRVSQPDLATELRIVRRQTEMGSLAQGFRQLADRIDLPELKSLSAIVVQSERLGTNLVAPLDTFSNDLRRDRRQRANARSASAVVRMMLPMVLCLLPATLILLWGPAVLELRDFWIKERGPGGALAIPADFRAPFIPDGLNREGEAAVDPFAGGTATQPASAAPVGTPAP